MDFQHDIVERLGDAATIDAANRAIRAAREHGVPATFVRVTFRTGRR